MSQALDISIFKKSNKKKLCLNEEMLLILLVQWKIVPIPISLTFFPYMSTNTFFASEQIFCLQIYFSSMIFCPALDLTCQCHMYVLKPTSFATYPTFFHLLIRKSWFSACHDPIPHVFFAS